MGTILLLDEVFREAVKDPGQLIYLAGASAAAKGADKDLEIYFHVSQTPPAQSWQREGLLFIPVAPGLYEGNNEPAQLNAYKIHRENQAMPKVAMRVNEAREISQSGHSRQFYDNSLRFYQFIHNNAGTEIKSIPTYWVATQEDFEARGMWDVMEPKIEKLKATIDDICAPR